MRQSHHWAYKRTASLSARQITVMASTSMRVATPINIYHCWSSSNIWGPAFLVPMVSLGGTGQDGVSTSVIPVYDTSTTSFWCVVLLVKTIGRLEKLVGGGDLVSTREME